MSHRLKTLWAKIRTPKPHQHKWRTTQVSRIGHPVMQVCVCGMDRRCVPAEPQTNRFHWDWLYPDGTRSVHTRDGCTHDWGNHFDEFIGDTRIDL